MAELKTRETEESVDAFLKRIPDEQRRADCIAVRDLMRELTGEEPKMWGSSIVGFGRYRYRYDSGRDGEWFVTGFSPRKSDLTLYLPTGFEHPADLMTKLGKHRSGRACLYLKRLRDVDLSVLRDLISRSLTFIAPNRLES